MPESVPAFDYLRELATYRPEVDAAIHRVLDSGLLILGPEVAAFEREFAAAVDAKYAIGVASGTDALILALRAMGIQAGQEVITVANTAVPTVSAIGAIGAIPQFVDIDAKTLQMCPASLKREIRATTRCILPVHLHGHPANMVAIEQIAEAAAVPVIGDCAQAHMAALDGKSVASFASINCYSFYPTKNLGCLGDGGMCVTDCSELASQLIELRQYGFRGDRTSHREGVCSRLDEVQAAVLRVRLRHLECGQARRLAIAQRYLSALADTDIVLPSSAENVKHAWHQFVIRSPRRPELCAYLQQVGIGYGVHYPLPIHLMPAYQALGYKRGSLPNCELAADQILSLPIYPGLCDEQVDRVIAGVREGARS